MKKILIIEDEKDLRDAYRTLLVTQGYEVDTANDGTSGLMKAELSKPDLVILDLIMPKSNGLDFLKAFDPISKNPNTKVIVFSNMMSPDTFEKAMAYGATKYLTKSSFSPKEMIELVKSLV